MFSPLNPCQRMRLNCCASTRSSLEKSIPAVFWPQYSAECCGFVIAPRAVFAGQVTGNCVLPTQIAAAFVYGSVARKTETAKSDIDLMVIGKASIDEVISHVAEVEKSTGRPINPTVYSVSEFKAKMADGNHFLKAVLKDPKVFLLGDEDELGKMG